MLRAFRNCLMVAALALFASCQTGGGDFVASPDSSGGGGEGSSSSGSSLFGSMAGSVSEGNREEGAGGPPNVGPLRIGVYCAFILDRPCQESAGIILRTIRQIGSQPRVLSSVDDGSANANVDMIVRLSYYEGLLGVTDTANAVSTYSGQTLFRLSATGSGDSAMRKLNASVSRILRRNFIVGASLYRSLASERPSNVARRQENLSPAAPASPPSANVSSRTSPKAFETLSRADLPDYRLPAQRDAYAIVVGIERYLTQIPNATYARRDAYAVKRHLQAMGFAERHIHMIVDRHATQAALKSELRWLRNNTDKNSLVFFYFSGHGAPDPASREAYLVTSDTRLDDLADSAFPLKDLYRSLDRLPAGHVIVALDSCFSGAGGRSVLETGSRPLVTVRTGTGNLGKTVALAAAANDQISGILRRKEHGVFTYYLLRSFNRKFSGAKDQGIPLSEIYAYVKPRVEDASRRHNRTQVPQILFQTSDPSRTYLK